MTPPPRPTPPVDGARLAANWRAVSAELDRPPPSRLERVLRWLRVPATATSLVAATPALRRSWFLALGLVVVIGIVAADPAEPRRSLFVLLFLAPLTPVLGVAMAYGVAADPAHEMQVAAPTTGVIRLLVRAATVLAVAIFVIFPLALLAPVTRPMAAAWLLPALALTMAALAMMTWLAPRRAATFVAVAWVVIVVPVNEASTDGLGAFGPIGQLAAILLAASSLLVVSARRQRFDRLELST